MFVLSAHVACTCWKLSTLLQLHYVWRGGCDPHKLCLWLVNGELLIMCCALCLLACILIYAYVDYISVNLWLVILWMCMGCCLPCCSGAPAVVGHGFGQKHVPVMGHGFLSGRISCSWAQNWVGKIQRVCARCQPYSLRLQANSVNGPCCRVTTPVGPAGQARGGHNPQHAAYTNNQMTKQTENFSSVS